MRQKLFVDVLRECKHTILIALLTITTVPNGRPPLKSDPFRWVSGPI